MAIFYEVKADLSESDLAVLADSGVKFVQPGIESLATSTLKLMKKGTTAFQNLRLLKLCSTYGIHPLWNLLVGFPGEGEDVYRRYVDLLPLIVHLQPPTGVYPVRFDRFSPYYNQRQSYGLDLLLQRQEHRRRLFHRDGPLDRKVARRSRRLGSSLG
jgi:magnesium-protoporphyrin IX monomethyl ester (oxidative) cyclase